MEELKELRVDLYYYFQISLNKIFRPYVAPLTSYVSLYCEKVILKMVFKFDPVMIGGRVL